VLLDALLFCSTIYCTKALKNVHSLMHFCISGAFFDLMKNRGVSVFLSPREEVVIPKFSQK
jgi:hypothetical protein